MSDDFVKEALKTNCKEKPCLINFELESRAFWVNRSYMYIIHLCL